MKIDFYFLTFLGRARSSSHETLSTLTTFRVQSEILSKFIQRPEFRFSYWKYWNLCFSLVRLQMTWSWSNFDKSHLFVLELVSCLNVCLCPVYKCARIVKITNKCLKTSIIFRNPRNFLTVNTVFVSVQKIDVLYLVLKCVYGFRYQHPSSASKIDLQKPEFRFLNSGDGIPPS